MDVLGNVYRLVGDFWMVNGIAAVTLPIEPLSRLARADD